LRSAERAVLIKGSAPHRYRQFGTFNSVSGIT
jgi:hypothetical protein